MPTRDGSTRTREPGITKTSTKSKGTQYRVRLSGVDGLTGEPVTVDQTFDTFELARDFKRKTSHELRAGVYHEPSEEAIADVLSHWLDTAKLAANTHKHYARVIANRINPAIGNVALGRLTGRQVQALYNQHRGSSYAGQISGILNGALRLAKQEGLIAYNVADGLSVPPAGETGDAPERFTLWTPDELRTFLDDRRGHWSFPVFWLAAHTGMRLSELINLRWEDVSEAPPSVYVRKAKSRAGIRTIAIDRETARVLREQRAAQEFRKGLLGAGWSESGAVFDLGAGAPVSPRTVEDVMQRAVRRLGLPEATPHSLRHHHATHLLRAGVPVHVVAKRLGHASPSTTLAIYAHVLPADDVAVLDVVEAALRGPDCQPIVTLLSSEGSGR